MGTGLSIFFIAVFSVLFSVISPSLGVRFKRQGEFGPARTTNKPFIDTDETGGIDLIASFLKITSAPAVDRAFEVVGPANVQTVPTTLPPGFTGPTPPTQQTTNYPLYPGYLVGSPYPFPVGGPPDIPNFGSKWNGPWGYPLGHYQSYRGTGQYIPNYAYYPLSYFGSALVPRAYSVSG